MTMPKVHIKENGVFISNEKATEPDLNMMPSVFDIYAVPWFDAEGIADAVHQYQNGKDKILYQEEDENEEIIDEDFLKEFKIPVYDEETGKN